MISIKRAFTTILVSGALAVGGVAYATPMIYDISVSGVWFDNEGDPFGMGASPTLSGTITVDDSISGISGLLDFSLTTGTHTWTAAEFVGASASGLTYDGAGVLTGFSLHGFSEIGGGSMYIYSNNTMGVSDASGAFNACNSCVSIGTGAPVAVPEPATLALLGLGLAGVGFMRRRKSN